MNKQIEDFARNKITDGLKQLPDAHQRMFKLMYGRLNGKRSVEEAENMDIADVAFEVPDSKLDWALTQVESSLIKLGI